MKKWMILGFSCLAFVFVVNNVYAIKMIQPINTTPDEYLDCGVWAYTPHKSGSNVVATGEISCDTNHSTLRVVAGVRDSTYRYHSSSKYCYNTNYCVTTASLSHVADREWQGDVSGYVGSWNA